ncbi:MAG: UDP-N-acetylmuramate--L-alanine ligase [Candidatus Margulisbacteria bacterium]|nr:UDP-N-acetylmuramate--L-alanine ligase [Candidatus Margulisiibacteriota bacterium]
MADLDMARVKNAHFVGIGGCGMSAIAKILFEMGFKVTGSDVRENPNTMRLKDLGIKVQIGHKMSNLRGADVVVYSSALSEDNVELREAAAKGIRILKRAEMLAWIMNQSQQRIAVAGTHGKTTTTAMLAKVLDFAKRNPTYLIGCDMDYAEGNAKLGRGEFAIAEADESDRSFLFLSPTIGVITNIEDDHMERFGTMQKVVETFESFANKVAETGFIAIDPSNENNREIIQRVKRRFITYGLNGESEYRTENMRFNSFSSSYHLIRSGNELGVVELSVPGWQNVVDSLAVFAVCIELGINFNVIASALHTFTGARRRFQTVGEYKNILVVDDYAHHPTEIMATLSAARSGWPNRRIICIFQPHRYSRTLLLKERFANAFSDADKIIITDIYAASEKSITGVSGKIIAEGIKDKDVTYIPKKEKIPAYLIDIVSEGDIILTLGAGDIYTTGKEILSRLKLKDEIPAQ